MPKIELTAEEAYDYSQALADTICFLWGYTANESNKDFNPYHSTMKDIIEDLRKIRKILTPLYKVKIENKEA